MSAFRLPQLFAPAVAVGIVCSSLPAQQATPGSSPAVAVGFVKVTPENTCLADGAALGGWDGAAGWKWLPEEGNGGVMESAGDPDLNAPPLRIIAEGLQPGADFEVFGYFWAPGFGQDGSEQHQPHHWPARFGLGLASLTPFGGRFSDHIPWVISPGSPVGEPFGCSAAVEESAPFPLRDGGLVTAAGDTRLIRARLGIARSDAAGTVVVFADDFPDSRYCGKTRIDGIGLRPAAEGATPVAGAGTKTALQLALRAGDSLSAKRELAAGADANALDSDGLAPLFHPALAGDGATVRLLLDAGAKPDVPGQSILPLTAAASTGNAAMVSLLLDAGAEVPSGMLEASPLLYPSLDPSHLHPAIAAIRAGSLDTLKRLLEKRPNLSLEALGPEFPQDAHSISNKSFTSWYLVEDAVLAGHDELAAFLIDRGCALRSRFLRPDPADGDTIPYAGLLVRSITEGEALVKTRAAISRRGLPGVLLKSRYNPSSRPPFEAAPWDALSAAIRMSDAALAAELMPKAKAARHLERDLYLALAQWAGEPRILTMVRQSFPDAVERQRALAGITSKGPAPGTREGLRLLLPRNQPAPAKQAAQPGECALALIAAPDAAGPAAMIEALASNEAGLTVVDREQIEAALREPHFANPWGNGERRLSDLGDHIAADLLVLVSVLKGKDLSLLRFEAVDVATGLAVLREHVELEGFDPEKSAAPLLARIRSAFDATRAFGNPIAVSMLPFSASKEISNADSMAAVFRSAIHGEVDSTPGVLAVGLNEVQAISREQTLGGQGSIWAAAFTLEGGLAPAASGQVALTLRLRSLRNPAEPHDVTELGAASDLPLLAARAWKQLTDAGALGAGRTAKHHPDPAQAAAEAGSLLREADWLLEFEPVAEVLPILERASLLGANPERLVALHLHCLAAAIPIIPAKLSRYLSNTGEREVRRNGITLEKPEILISEHPPTLLHQQMMVESLPACRTLLHQASYYLERHGAAALAWRGQGIEFWNALRILAYIRASMPKALLTGETGETFAAFAADLDRFTADYFRVRASAPRPAIAPYDPYSFSMAAGTMLDRNPWNPIIHSLTHGFHVTGAMLERNPELLKGFISTMFAASASKANGGREVNYFLEHLLGAALGTPSQWYGKTCMIAEAVAARMEDCHGPLEDHHAAVLEFLRSSGESRAQAARELAAACARLTRRDRLHASFWARPYPPARFGTAALMKDAFSYYGAWHSADFIPALAQEPTSAPDWIGRPIYSKFAYKLMELEELPPSDAARNRLSNGPEAAYRAALDKAAKAPDPRTELSTLLGGAALYQLTFGHPVEGALAAPWKHLLTPEKTSAPALSKARLLADLRKGPAGKVGIFETPVIDNSSPQRLWLHYHPYENETVVVSGVSYDITKRCQPWLMAVDCNDGSFPVSVNLATATGLKPGAAASHSLVGPESESNHLVQTRTTLLTNAIWTPIQRSPGDVTAVSVLIDKESGRMTPLEPPALVGSPRDAIWGNPKSSGAAALGDAFYFLQPASDPGKSVNHSEHMPFQLMRADASGKVRPLTVFGRRPELSPFDPENRSPRTILPDGQRLYVFHSWDHIGYYNPAGETWEMDTRDEKAKGSSASDLMRADFQSRIFPHHRVHVGKDTIVINIDSKNTHPSRLSFTPLSGPGGEIEVSLEIPDDFKQRTVFIDHRTSAQDPKGKFRFDELSETGRFHLVVLQQTETDLILGLQTRPGHTSYPGGREGQYLPLLWALSKQDFAAVALEKIQANP